MMFKLIIGSSFEFSYECGGLFLRIGQRDWFYSRELGFSGRIGKREWFCSRWEVQGSITSN